MQLKRIPRPSAAMVIAMLALMAALGGTVYAASKINGKSIKKNSIPGNRLKKQTVTGKQIKLSTLGAVPNSSALGGQPPSAYYGSARVKNSGLVKAAQGQTVPVLNSGPFSLSLQCAAGGGGTTVATLVAASTEANSSLDSSSTLGTSNTLDTETSAVFAADTGAARSLVAPSGALLQGVSNAGVNGLGAACFASFDGFATP